MVKTSGADSLQTPELEIRVSKSWIRLIRFTQTSVPHGQVCFKTANGEPTDLVDEHTKRRIRFDKEEIQAELGSVKF